MAIVELPEIPPRPVVVKVPVTLGNVEKLYTAVMVTGTGVGVEADAESTEPIAKQPSTNRIVNIMFRFFIFNFSFLLFLAFFGPENVRGYFWPFTNVLQEIRREVTRKLGKSLKR